MDDESTVDDKMWEWMDFVIERMHTSGVIEGEKPIQQKLSYKAWNKLSKAERAALARQHVLGCG